MAFRTPTREDDEALLRWIAWRCEGYLAADIARHEGAACQSVRTVTNRVRHADEDHVGRPLAKEYW